MKIVALRRHSRGNQQGFSLVEIVVATTIFSIVVIGLMGELNGVRQSYFIARQLNEMYTVLSACPEIDRALDFNALTGTSNCFPNNTFPAEDGGPGTITYSPAISVTDTTSLGSTDPLKSIPDSKVVDITVGFQKPYTSRPKLELRMLITRNGIGQL